MPSETVQVAAPAQRVWELLSDVRRMGEWSPETIRAEWISGATGPAVGARFRGYNKRKASWRTTCTVTTAEPGREFAFDVGRDTRWRYAFTSDGDGGCQVTESFEILRVPGAIGRWLTGLGTGVPWVEREADLRAGMRETLRRLKAAAERS